MAQVEHRSAFKVNNSRTITISHRNTYSILKALTSRMLTTYRQINPDLIISAQPALILTDPYIALHNYGLDNAKHELIVRIGDILGTATSFEGRQFSMNPGTVSRYEVVGKLGQGTFGNVYKCTDLINQRDVAIKILKNKKAYFRQGMLEVTSLLVLNKFYDPKKLIVEMYDHFLYCGHLCIVTELLGSSLHELMKLNRRNGFSLPTIQLLSKQMLESLDVCKKANIIHCDVKPENVLLTGTTPRLKLIDLGSCCFDNCTLYTYIQSRFYRAPEICIGYPYTSAIDMWSFGCMVAEMFFGIPLFVASSELGLLRKQVQLLGVPPTDMLENGSKSDNYFAKYYHADDTYEYVLKDDEEYETEFGTEIPEEKDYFKKNSLKELVYLHNIILDVSKVPVDAATLRLTLFDFLNRCLAYRPDERMTPEEALAHPLFNSKLKSEKDMKKKTRVPNLQLKIPKKKKDSAKLKDDEKLESLEEKSKEEDKKRNYNITSEYYQVFMEQLSKGHIPLITEDNPFEKGMTPDSFPLVFQRELISPQPIIEKQAHTPRRIRTASVGGEPTSAREHRLCLFKNEKEKEKDKDKESKKNYKIPTLKKVQHDDSSSESTTSSFSSPRKRVFSFVSPRKAESPKESPRSGSKLSFLVPSFMKKKKRRGSVGAEENAEESSPDTSV
ncbi:serine/threonine protein kinase ppk15, putative [Entamoeba invadens IP1]|uniref:Serine/threonine protein kinase ppk15, putative n=1 Tax=Entamoeba invadens IP1 TaxID=370355 RepID=A0A0A1U895_ENTIV|nr:serine/threonine protein kinase ppk15, putative [Entamoeba invadens IP1]ELP91056.1 serine/threonine protein kinase ppk15, putative [Entamoeba invadens IP1]|eukprot:XP_004257827.1 serine/threonine protein kinase ppk15, putative [Entamoeba invadens IP1]